RRRLPDARLPPRDHARLQGLQEGQADHAQHPQGRQEVRAAIAVALALFLIAPASALAKKTADFTYKSTGKAATPGVAAAGADGTFEDFPFTIAADDADGQVSVEVHWSNPADDWDLVV